MFFVEVVDLYVFLWDVFLGDVDVWFWYVFGFWWWLGYVFVFFGLVIEMFIEFVENVVGVYVVGDCEDY